VSYQTILFECEGPVAVVTLNRPERANAMNRTMLEELLDVCDTVEGMSDIRALVLTGAGEAFCSGFDLKDQAANRPDGVEQWRDALQIDYDAVMRFWHLPIPTVAAVRGPALAGGFELSMACDMTVAAEGSVFGEPELRFGAGIVVMLLPWLAGPKAAKEIILLGRDDISVESAFDLGLVNRIVPPGEDLSEAMDIAKRLAVIDPMLVKQTKRAINASFTIMGMDQALQNALDIDVQIEGQGSPDKTEFLRLLREEGMKAALSWRDARFGDDA